MRMIKFATSEQLKRASDILRAEYPTPKVSHTVDFYVDLSPLDRQVLFISDRMKVKLLESPKKSVGGFG